MTRLLAVPLSILVAGSLITLSSIGFSFFVQQAIALVLGIAVIIGARQLDWRGVLSGSWVYLPYVAALLLLLFALFFGPTIRNIKGWIVLGPLSFQPVELAKLSLILLYAKYLARAHVTIAKFSTLAITAVLVGLPLGLVLLQPDLGSGLVLLATWGGMILVSGLPRRRILAGLLLGLTTLTFAWFFVLAPYQKARVMGIINPNQDLLGVNYSTNQAKIAVGSAGWLGKGYGQGTQTQLDFLTEPQGDFIIAALAEEWGAVGLLVMIGAFIMLLINILRIGVMTPRNVERLLCLGVVLAFLTQASLNVGSTLGLLPVIGVPFPFLSHGGSSLLTSLALVAIVNAIAYRARH